MDSSQYTLSPRRCRLLPALAWGAVVRAGQRLVDVVHGNDVHANEQMVVEGAWSEEFSTRGLWAAEHVVGSGIFVDEGLKVRGASHTLERLWCVRSSAMLVVSNSLPLALALSGLPVPLDAVHLEADLMSFIDGVKHVRNALFRTEKGQLLQFVCARLEINSTLDIAHCRESAERAPLSSFSEYHAAVHECVTSICDNARYSGRVSNYQPLATVSRGYDSPACAVIARSCGATEAITFVDARGGFDDDNDDGSFIASRLGLKATCFSRTDYLQGDGLAEVTSLASGGGGEDVVLAAATQKLYNSVLFTGFLGDTLWGMTGDPRNSEELRIVFPGGGSLGEFRLAAGFVHVPIPMLFLRSHRDVLAISSSDEMSPWRLDTNYDRPIPRRIAEEAGVPRDAFGRSKMAITAPMYYDEPTKVLSESARTRFETFMDGNAVAIERMVETYRRGHDIAKRTRAVTHRISTRTGRFDTLFRLSRALEPRLSDRYRRLPSAQLFLVHWAVNELREAYTAAIAETL